MLHVITCHFNPQRYKRPVENFYRFLDSLSSDIILHAVELSFDGRFDLPDDVLRITGNARNVMWQKERLLNLLVERLPASVSEIAWIDADLMFLSNDWVKRTVRALEELPVVQLFQSAHFLDQNSHVIRSNPSLMSTIGHDTDSNLVSPGFAWAARREVFPLYDAAVCGGGDRLMVDSWRGTFRRCGDLMGRAWREHWVAESKRQADLINAQFGFLRGDIVHMWHGRMDRRNYTGRYAYLKSCAFDPNRDISIDDNGVWKWSTEKTEMHEAVAAYFAERKEDG